jgi:hypothetical protein
MLLKQLDPAAAATPTRRSAGADDRRADAYAPRAGDPPVSTQVYSTPIAARFRSSWRCSTRRSPSRTSSRWRARATSTASACTASCPTSWSRTATPRGDGEGGPGYSIRDELNERPYLRGTVGMALDPLPDTGGSQYFIAHSPQPHLDAKYTGVRPRHRGHGRGRQDSAVGRDPIGEGLGRPDDDEPMNAERVIRG